MGFAEAKARAVPRIYSSTGIAAKYHSVGGVVYSVTVVPDFSVVDVASELGSSVREEVFAVYVQVSEIAVPSKGDIIIVGGRKLIVVRPERKSLEQWMLVVREDVG